MSIDKLKSKFVTGAFISDVKHYFSKINEIIDYLNNLVSYSPPYKVYTGLLNQSGTSAPTSIVLENTLGDTITFGYLGVGYYSILSNGSFTANKTFIVIGNNVVETQVDIYVKRDTDSYIFMWVNFNDTGSNDELQNTPIEIRIYN